MALSLSNFDQVLKEYYEGAIRETINSEVPLFKYLSETDKEWAGRTVRWPVHTTRNSGVGARADGGTLPTAGNQGHQVSVVSSCYLYGRIQVSGPTIRAGKNAFAQAMQVEMDGIVKDLKNDCGRQTWGDGSGRLAQVGAAGASASNIAVFNRFAEPGQPGARYIYQGMVIDAGTVAAPTTAFSSQTVTAVSISENPATTTDTVTTSNSALSVSQSEHFLFNRGAGGTGVEMMGVLGLVDVFTQSNWWGSNAFAGSSVQGIARDSVSQWNSLVLANSGVARIIDSNLMQVAFDKIHLESGEEPDMIMGHHDVVRAFLDSVSADRRYVASGAPAYDGGHSSLSYNGVQIERDRQAPYNCLLVMKKDALRQYTLLDFGFADDDGAILSRVSNVDAFEAYLRAYKNLGLEKSPKCALMIRDIKTDF